MLFYFFLYCSYFFFAMVHGTPCSSDEINNFILCTNWNDTEMEGNENEVNSCFLKNNCSVPPTVPPPGPSTSPATTTNVPPTSPTPNVVSSATPSVPPSGTPPNVPSTSTISFPPTVTTVHATVSPNNQQDRGSHGNGKGKGKGSGSNQSQSKGKGKGKGWHKGWDTDNKRRKRQSIPSGDAKNCVKDQRDKFLTKVETCIKTKIPNFVFQKGRTHNSPLINEASCPAMTKVSDCIENLKTKNLEKAKTKLCNNEKRCKKNSTCSVDETERVICTCAESEITKSKGQIKKDFINCLGLKANSTRTDNGINKLVDDKNIREFLMNQNELLTRFCVAEKKINCV